jgi:hypothetical protein
MKHSACDNQLLAAGLSRQRISGLVSIFSSRQNERTRANVDQIRNSAVQLALVYD